MATAKKKRARVPPGSYRSERIIKGRIGRRRTAKKVDVKKGGTTFLPIGICYASGFRLYTAMKTKEEGRKHTANLAHTHTLPAFALLWACERSLGRERRGGDTYRSDSSASCWPVARDPPCSKAKEKFCLNVSIGDKRGTLVCICTWRINTPQKKRGEKHPDKTMRSHPPSF
jgi:hypothetical protein